MASKEKVASEKSEMGKKSRAKGQRFESKVRQNLEEMGWTVAKWTNSVDYDRSNGIGKIIPSKRKYNPFLKALSIGTGFPDFVCFKRRTTSGFLQSPATQVQEKPESSDGNYEVIGLEVKGNGYLDQTEKGMCLWLLENKIFSRILIAKNSKEKGKIDYIDFNVKYKKE